MEPGQKGSLVGERDFGFHPDWEGYALGSSTLEEGLGRHLGLARIVTCWLAKGDGSRDRQSNRHYNPVRSLYGILAPVYVKKSVLGGDAIELRYLLPQLSCCVFDPTMLLPTLQQETEYVDVRPSHREPASFYEKWVDQCPCSLALVPLSGANFHSSFCKAFHPRASCVSLHTRCSMDDIHRLNDSVFLSFAARTPCGVFTQSARSSSRKTTDSAASSRCLISQSIPRKQIHNSS